MLGVGPGGWYIQDSCEVFRGCTNHNQYRTAHHNEDICTPGWMRKSNNTHVCIKMFAILELVHPLSSEKYLESMHYIICIAQTFI